MNRSLRRGKKTEFFKKKDTKEINTRILRKSIPMRDEWRGCGIRGREREKEQRLKTEVQSGERRDKIDVRHFRPRQGVASEGRPPS